MESVTSQDPDASGSESDRSLNELSVEELEGLRRSAVMSGDMARAAELGQAIDRLQDRN
jgi:hypothetical protein